MWKRTKTTARQRFIRSEYGLENGLTFFDVKATRSNDYYLTITESKRRYKDDGYFYEKHKIFLYKEDFDKFVDALRGSVDHVKTELMPEVDFSQFEQKDQEEVQVGTNSGLDEELSWE